VAKFDTAVDCVHITDTLLHGSGGVLRSHRQPVRWSSKWRVTESQFKKWYIHV